MNNITTAGAPGARLGFLSMEEEVRVADAPVTGTIPGWLRGSLMRVSPGLLDIGGRPVGHWFDGMGMLNVFTIGDGRVSYASRYLDTGAYRAARAGRQRPMTFATDPCRHLGQRITALFDPDMINTNINVAKLGDRFVALSEMPVPVEFDPETLKTYGVMKFQDDIPGQTGPLSHSHWDRVSREMVSVVTRVGLRSNEHIVFALPPGSLTRRRVATIPAGRKPEYMHSFGMSERYVIIAAIPMTYTFLRGARSGKFQDSFNWDPEGKTRFIVIDRHRGVLKGEYETDGFFSWHHANSFEEGDDLIVDLVAGDPARLAATGDDYQVGRLRDPAHKVRMCGELRRYRIPLEGGPVTWHRVSDADVEFPRINYARNTVGYQHCYCIAYGSPGSDWFDEIVKIDVRTGAKQTWSEEGCYPSEPLYAQAPGATAGDDGVLLNVVLDARAGRSFMLILDAASMTELARVEAPHHIPFNFHQQYFPDKPHSVEAGA